MWWLYSRGSCACDGFSMVNICFEMYKHAILAWPTTHFWPILHLRLHLLRVRFERVHVAFLHRPAHIQTFHRIRLWYLSFY